MRKLEKSIIDDLLEEVTSQEKRRDYVEKVTPKVENGVFTITFKTRRSTQKAQTSLAEADHYPHIALSLD